MSKKTSTKTEASAEPRRREVRWSAKKKQELVMRLFRGESLDALSRETGLPASRIASWCDASLEAVEGALKSKPSTDELGGVEKAALERKLGELLMTNELLEEKMRRLQQRPFPGRRSKK